MLLLTLSQCRPPESADNAPCERCVKEGCFCEYRPVDSSSSPNNHVPNYPDQDNPVNLYPVHPVPVPNQQSPPLNQPYWPVLPPTSGGYVPNQTYNPVTQAPLQATHLYPTYQHIHPSSYPVPQYPYTSTSGYPAGQSNYQSSSQLGGHPSSQYMPYAPAPGYDQR